MTTDRYAGKLVWLTRLSLFAVLLAGCSLAPVSGTLTLPDGSAVQYVSKTVETSFLNATTITATKADPGVDVKVAQGESVGDAGVKAASTILGGWMALTTFCAAGNC